MQTEEWRDVVGSSGAYRVSSSGAVVSLKYKAPLTLTPSHDKDGYLYVCLRVDGRQYNRRLHRLVLDAFVGERPAGSVGCHLDGNKLNNHISNLEWATQVENQRHRFLHGTDSRGEKHGLSKLTEQSVIAIRQRAGEKFRDLAKEFGVSPSLVSHVVYGRAWTHVDSTTGPEDAANNEPA